LYESFATVWEAVADAIPDATAVVQGERAVRWRDVEDHAARLAAGLAAEGVAPGTHVALFLFNCPEYMECTFACSKLRALSANVNFRYEAAELAALLENSDAEVLVFHRSLGERVASVRDRLPKLRVLIEIDDGKTAPLVTGAIAYDDLLATNEPLPRIERSGDDMLLWYTGGTTGLPKGVLWHQGTLLNYGAVYAAGVIDRAVPETVAEAAECALDLYRRDSRPVPLLTTPLVHATAVHQANTWFSLGGKVALLPRGPVDGGVVCATIARERVTLLSLVGDVILRRIVRALEEADARGEPYDLSSLRRVHNSGAMVNASLKDALLRHGTMNFYDSLGSSEGVGFGVALTTTPGEHTTARFALGPRARVVTEDGRDVVPGSGEQGMIAVAHSAAVGYYKDPERSAATFRDIDGTRYAVPGDWAIVHDDQTITLLGRGSGCINTGGEKVWPEEVEEVLKNHPAVLDAIVVGIPDEEWGESVAAVVSLRADHDGASPTPDELSAWVGQLIASYKRPRRVVVVEQVQRTTVGKADYTWARTVLA
jgi:acyl-CoA synthetase (AMP-forming)/AMP-acid ligase II